MGYAAAREDRALFAPVLGYVGLLAGTLATAGHLAPTLPPAARHRAAAGAALFLVSDGLLGTRQFCWRTAPGWSDSAVMATYTLGQLLLSKAAASAR